MTAPTHPRATEQTQSPRLRILIACEDEDRRGKLAAAVRETGHEAIAGRVRLLDDPDLGERESPDVALVIIGSGAEATLETIDFIVARALCPVIAIVGEDSAGAVYKLSRLGVFAVVSDRDADEWKLAIAVVLIRFAEYHKLHAAFTRRAVIERASGILMERHQVDGEAAMRMLRQTARHGNRKLSDLATAVVDGHCLLPADPP